MEERGSVGGRECGREREELEMGCLGGMSARRKQTTASVAPEPVQAEYDNGVDETHGKLPRSASSGGASSSSTSVKMAAFTRTASASSIEKRSTQAQVANRRRASGGSGSSTSSSSGSGGDCHGESKHVPAAFLQPNTFSGETRSPLEKAKGAGVNFFNRAPPPPDAASVEQVVSPEERGRCTAYEDAISDKWNARRIARKKLGSTARIASRRRSSFDEYCAFMGLEETIGQDKVREWQKTFNSYDKDSCGKITGTDLLTCLREVGFNPTVPRLLELLNFLDEDTPSGRTFIERRKTDEYTLVSFYEFAHIAYVIEQEERDLVDILFLAFRFLDADGNGTLSKEEFETVMMNVGDPLTKEEVDLTFDFFDTDGNGEIEYYEFLHFFKKQDEAEGAPLPIRTESETKSPHKSQREIKKALISQRSKARLKRNASLTPSQSGSFRRSSSSSSSDLNIQAAALATKQHQQQQQKEEEEEEEEGHHELTKQQSAPQAHDVVDHHNQQQHRRHSAKPIRGRGHLPLQKSFSDNFS